MGTSHKTLNGRLDAIAAAQQGFFTTGQALEAGYADSVHSYHVRNGDWEKAWRGVYRLASHPLPAWPELVVWSLWSRGRGDVRPQGVYSHETALAIHGVVGRRGRKLHMTVPGRFRRSAEVPGEMVLHKADLPDSDTEEREGYRVTTLERTLRDMREPGADPALLALVERLAPDVEGQHGQAAVPGRPTAPPASVPVPKPGVVEEVPVPRQVARAKELVPVPKQSGAARSRAADYDDWDGPWDRPVQPCMWRPGMTFEQALEAGED